MFLDPVKLLVVGVVALLVLGPDQLPKTAKTAGSLWHDIRRWRASLDEQVRGAFPDLPPTHEIAAAVRSPLALLDRLAERPVAPVSGAVVPVTVSGPTSPTDREAPPEREAVDTGDSRPSTRPTASSVGGTDGGRDPTDVDVASMN